MIEKNGKVFWLSFVWLVTVFLISAGVSPMVQAESSQDGAALTDVYYGQKEEVTTPLDDVVSIFDGAVGTEDGRQVMYTTSKGEPPKLSVIDINSDELLRVIELEDAERTWAHEVTVDNDLYIATIGGGAKLWKYTPGSNQASIVAEMEGETFPYSITSDDEGNVYVGTYPGGKVFKYNPDTEDLTAYGQMNPEKSQEYVRSIAYDDGNIYAGTGSDKIIQYNIESETKTDIAAELNETGTVYDMEIVDSRYLFTRYKSSSNAYIYDTQNKEWLDVVIPNVRGLHVEEESYEDKIYYMTHDDKFMSVNLNSLEISDTGMRYNSGLRGADWVELEDPELPGKSLVTINWSGYVVIFNIETEQVITGSQLAAGTPTVTNEIEKGPDGNLYISGMQSTKGAIYDPLNESMASFQIGQAGTISPFGDKLLMGQYPGASIFEYDTNEEPSDSNPTELFQIGEEQDRIGDIVGGDGKAFVASIPDYNKLGGALTVYDPEAEEKVSVHRNIVQDQSIVSLAYKDGIIYGSTTINGGLGSEPAANEAKIFVWDAEQEKKLNGMSLEIDGVDQPETIGDLSFGPDGLLWGAAENVVFALDADTLEVVKSKKVYPDNSLYYGAWQTIELKWLDGLLYANFDNNLTVVDPETMDSQKITDAYNFTFSNSGDLYFSLPTNRTLLYNMDIFSISLTKEVIDNYQAAGDIEQPLVSKLTNKLNQAKHHSDKGHTKQAIKQLNDFLKHLNNPAQAKFITDDVKEVLQHKVEQLIQKRNGDEGNSNKPLYVENPYFEEPVVDGNVPGWTSDFEETEDYYSKITDEKSFDGDYSLKITDTVRNGSVAMISNPIAITPGEEYKASARVMLENGEASWMIRFYDENDQQVGSAPYYFGTPLGQWADVETTGVSPDNAAYARIYAYTTRYQIAEVYYDSISFEAM